MDRRTDYKTALLIEAIIRDTAVAGQSPARALAALGVPFEAAMRLLTRPAERRVGQPERLLEEQMRWS
jgi:hypothetical protein